MKRSMLMSTLAASIALALTGCNSDDDNNASTGPEGSVTPNEPGGFMYFFEEGVPDAITAEAGGILSLSSKHFKDGGKSLEWQFQESSELVFDQPIGFDPANEIEVTPQTFMAWIYNEVPSEGKVTFNFGEGDNVLASFKYGLDFKGWRGISVPFHDMEGNPSAGMDRLTVMSPANSGKIYLDQVMMSVPVDYRWPTPDYQQPFVNTEVNDMVSKNWSALLMYDQMLRDQHPTFDFDAEFDDQSGDTASLYTKYDQHLGVKAATLITSDMVTKELAKYPQFMITKDAEGNISGKPLDHPNRQKFFKAAGVVQESTLAMLTDTKGLRDLGKVMKTTANLLRGDLSGLTEEERISLENAFVDAARHSFDQGFEGGSGFQVISHVGYQTREYFDALFIARQLLAREGLLKQAQESMMWFSATGRVFEPVDEINSSNVDIMNTQLQWMIKSFLLLPNVGERSTMLTQLKDWLSTTLLASDGLAGGIKEDGSIFHHSQHYPAYAKDSYGGLAPSVYGLSGSPYMITPASHQHINGALMMMRTYTKDLNTPVVLAGRHPDGKAKITSLPFKWLAMAGTPDGSSNIEPSLAAAYANLSNAAAFEGVVAESEPTGSWVMNHASMTIMRGEGQGNPEDSWLATVRGFSRYLVGNETYAANNLYGRYLQYGQFEITPSDISKRAFSHDGWNWSRFPGITAINLPNEQLKAELNQLEGAGIEEMLLSTESFSGGNRLHDQAAMFAMKLVGHQKYGQQGFSANKSYFMFDNHVIALGSNVNSDDNSNPVETTLFQHFVPNAEEVEVNGVLVNSLGEEKVLDGEITLEDPAGNRYFITTTAEQPVRFSYVEQASNDEDNGAETRGKFASAVLDHGMAPDNKGYEYAISIEATSDDKPAYEVKEHRTQVHGVEYLGVEAYAIFSENVDISNSKYLLSVETPSQIMLEPGDVANQLSLSVMNPDFAFYKGEDPDQVGPNGEQVEVSIYSRPWLYNNSQPVYTTFTLKGEWDLAASVSGVRVHFDDRNTLVTTTTVNAKPLLFGLNKVVK